MNPRLPLVLCLVRVHLEKTAWSIIVGLLAVGLFSVASPWRPINVIITIITLGLTASIYWPHGMRAQAEYEATLPVGRALANAARVLALLCAVLLIVGCWGGCYYNGNLVRAAHWLGEHLRKPNIFAHYYEQCREMFELNWRMPGYQKNTGFAVRTTLCLAWYSALGLAVVLKLTRWWRVAAGVIIMVVGIVAWLWGSNPTRPSAADLLAYRMYVQTIIANVMLNAILIGLLVFPRRVR